LLIGLILTAEAQAQVETVVITGSRMREDAEYNPHVTVSARADHLITKVRVVCDTREPSKRREELRQTLRNMIADAERSKTISLSVGDDMLVPFAADMLDKVIVPDTKVDTSDAYVVVRTELTKEDAFDGATGRIRDFLMHTAKAGRTEVLIEERFNLGLIDPERYRGDLIAKIAGDAKATAAAFGDGYDAQLEGLQHTIEWYQTGPLDLALYLPYRMTIAPRHT
jgi:hypothetical protein